MGKHLVLVGGGHAHMTTLLHLGDFLQRGHRVTLISASACHYYSGMGPGILSGMYRVREVRFHVEVGVYAVRQNPLLRHNLLAALQGMPLLAFDPGGPCLLILNMGDGSGILWKRNFVWEGKLAFIIKDNIERKFMRKFQVSGELTDTP